MFIHFGSDHAHTVTRKPVYWSWKTGVLVAARLLGDRRLVSGRKHVHSSHFLLDKRAWRLLPWKRREPDWWDLVFIAICSQIMLNLGFCVISSFYFALGWEFYHFLWGIKYTHLREFYSFVLFFSISHWNWFPPNWLWVLKKCWKYCFSLQNPTVKNWEKKSKFFFSTIW